MTEVRLKHAYYDRCLMRYSKPPKVLFTKADISVTLYVWNLMDEGDNLRARLKWPLDWLVLREYIEDDSPRTLVWGPVLQTIDRKNQRIEVELTGIVEETPITA